MLVGPEKVKFPEKCPDKCPFWGSPIYQGSICFRCPIIVCGPVPLVEPEDYRADWARIWREWFDAGMAGYPELPLR